MRGVVPIKRATRLHMQMNDGCETAGNCEQIGSKTLLFSPDIGLDQSETMLRSLYGFGERVGVHLKAAFGVQRNITAFGPCIEDGNDLGPCLLQRLRSMIRIIIVGGDNNAFARDHTETLHICAHGLR